MDFESAQVFSHADDVTEETIEIAVELAPGRVSTSTRVDINLLPHD